MSTDGKYERSTCGPTARVTSDSVDDQDFQSTSLGTLPTPSLEEINSDPQFSGIEISAVEFDQAWKRYVKR